MREYKNYANLDFSVADVEAACALTPTRPASAPFAGLRPRGRHRRGRFLRKGIQRVRARSARRVRSNSEHELKAHSQWAAMREKFLESRALHRKLRQGTVEVVLHGARNLSQESGDRGESADPIAILTLHNASARGATPLSAEHRRRIPRG